MIVRRLDSWNDAAALSDAWNRLAHSMPFRQWEWLSAWWQHYSSDKEWFVLAVHDADGRLAGIAPWFRQQVPTFGRVVSFLGSGHACSDYLSVLCDPADSAAVTSSLAEWLVDTSRSEGDDRWAMLSLEGMASDDEVIGQLLEALRQAGCTVHVRNDTQTWRVPLPDSWDAYRQQLSKPNRRHVRVLQERLVEPGVVAVHVVSNAAELERAWAVLVELHQRRRHELKQPGCFASSEFAGFARQAAESFLRRGQLELLWIEHSGTPLAAQLAFLGDRTTYAYQVGIDPTRLSESPGWLVHTESIKRAIQLGHTTFDFLRGNEPHKQRMGAAARPLATIRVVPPRLGLKMLHTAWVTGDAFKSWLKTGLQITGIRT
jgi:CelD/BcsL family acetyltransferase involved in cellulose biosynthesis